MLPDVQTTSTGYVAKDELMLVGLSGCKGVGKDTVAQWMIENLNFKRLAFADKLKEAVANLFGISVEDVDKYKEPQDKWGEQLAPMPEIVFRYWEDSSDRAPGPCWSSREVAYFTWRQFLQRFGTEMGRETFGQNFWVDRLLPTTHPHATYGHNRLVISDVRFENEAQRIRECGGFNIEIIRPGHEPDGHASEEPIPPRLIDTRIHNSGTLGDLYADVYNTFKELQRI